MSACNKFSDGWNTTVDREKHLRAEHIFDVLGVGMRHLVNAAESSLIVWW